MVQPWRCFTAPEGDNHGSLLTSWQFEKPTSVLHWCGRLGLSDTNVHSVERDRRLHADKLWCLCATVLWMQCFSVKKVCPLLIFSLVRSRVSDDRDSFFFRWNPLQALTFLLQGVCWRASRKVATIRLGWILTLALVSWRPELKLRCGRHGFANKLLGNWENRWCTTTIWMVLGGVLDLSPFFAILEFSLYDVDDIMIFSSGCTNNHCICSS
jgi:hypothetical protein